MCEVFCSTSSCWSAYRTSAAVLSADGWSTYASDGSLDTAHIEITIEKAPKLWDCGLYRKEEGWPSCCQILAREDRESSPAVALHTSVKFGVCSLTTVEGRLPLVWHSNRVGQLDVVTWEFFLAEFRKKYINCIYLEDRRRKFIALSRDRWQ